MYVVIRYCVYKLLCWNCFYVEVVVLEMKVYVVRLMSYLIFGEDVFLIFVKGCVEMIVVVFVSWYLVVWVMIVKDCLI